MLAFVDFVDLFRCDVIHLVNWTLLCEFPACLVTGKRIVAHMTHDPTVAFAHPKFATASRLVSIWIVRSSRAYELMAGRGLRVALVPYTVDDRVFYHIPKSDPRLGEIIQRWGIPSDTYLIGSFQRDTEGSDLRSPKRVKGPDIFADIVKSVYQVYPRVHVVLAGPRRFWLRNRLTELGIPFTFVGIETEGDDLTTNNLSQATVNLLYNLVDLYLVTSRLEGGPQAVIEAAAARCKIISSDVGHAPDVLHPMCIYRSVEEAVNLILQDVESSILTQTVEYNYESVQRYTNRAVAPQWYQVYEELEKIAPISASEASVLPGLLEVMRRRFVARWRR